MKEIFGCSDESATRAHFLNLWLNENEDNSGPDYFIINEVAPRWNIVFDIDHTLIFSFATDLVTIEPGKIENSARLTLSNNITLFLSLRKNTTDLLEYLGSFCNLYVYSHGLKEYVLKILSVIDPHELYFKERHIRVLAPHDP